MFLSLVFVVALLALPHFAHAAGLVPCGGTGPTDNHPCGITDMVYMVARVTNWLILMAGIYAVFQMVNAGFWLVTTAGNEESVAKWRKSLTNTVVGFFIVMGAYMFMNTAVNMILHSKCKIDFANPLMYVTIQDPNSCTTASPGSPGYNPYNSDINTTTPAQN